MTLRADDITVAYRKRQVLHGISVRAGAGAVTAICGPNGSGKSTLLKAICGELHYGGQVTLDGDDVRQRPAWTLAARRGVLPQATTLAFPFTAIEVVRIGLREGVNGADAHLPLHALERVGLAHKANNYFQELSGGEQQRVQLARVLAQVWEPLDGAGQPRWLMMDEPVASLDVAHQQTVMQITRSFAQGGGGVLVVMHDLNLTALYADQMVIMAEGQVIADGTPEDVMTEATLSRAYGYPVRVNQAPAASPFVLPYLPA